MLVYTVLTTAKYAVCQQLKQIICIPDDMDVDFLFINKDITFSDKDNQAI